MKAITQPSLSSQAQPPLAATHNMPLYIFANQVVFASDAKSEGIRSENGAAATCHWSTRWPHLYNTAIKSAIYKMERVPRQGVKVAVGALYSDSDSKTLSATLRYEWTTEENGDAVLSIAIGILDEALRPQESSLKNQVTIADRREIMFTIATSEGKAVLTSGRIVSADGRELVRLSLKESAPIDSSTEDISEITEPLQDKFLPSDILGYYSMRKQFYKIREMAESERAMFAVRTASECEQLIATMSKRKDAPRNVILASEHLAMDAYKWIGRVADWAKVTRSHLKRISSWADERQWQLEVGWAIVYSLERRNRELLDEFACEYVSHVTRKMDGSGAYSLSQRRWNDEAGIYAVKLLEYAKSQAEDEFSRKKCSVELSLAWAILADQLVRRWRWPVEMVADYLRAGQQELAEYEQLATDQERAESTETIRRVKGILAGFSATLPAAASNTK